MSQPAVSRPHARQPARPHVAPTALREACSCVCLRRTGSDKLRSFEGILPSHPGESEWHLLYSLPLGLRLAHTSWFHTTQTVHEHGSPGIGLFFPSLYLNRPMCPKTEQNKNVHLCNPL